MFEAAIDRSDYAPVDKLNYLKSKLKSEVLEAISGYQLTNENYPVPYSVKFWRGNILTNLTNFANLSNFSLSNFK